MRTQLTRYHFLDYKWVILIYFTFTCNFYINDTSSQSKTYAFSFYKVLRQVLLISPSKNANLHQRIYPATSTLQADSPNISRKFSTSAILLRHINFLPTAISNSRSRKRTRTYNIFLHPFLIIPSNRISKKLSCTKCALHPVNARAQLQQ